MATNNDEPSKGFIRWHHLFYCGVIFIILTIFFWTMAMNESNDAVRLFSFAATITSIVLAVVSIVFSIVSGFKTFRSVGSIQDASDRIGNVGEKLETIQASLTDDISHLTTIEQDIHTVIEEVKRTRNIVENGLGQNKQQFTTPTENENQFDVANSSIAGLIIIYACSLAYKKGKAFPAALTGNPFYAHGYITALEISSSKYFRALALPSGYVQVSVFNENYFGKATDATYISAQMQGKSGYAQALEALEKIKQFYEVK